MAWTAPMTATANAAFTAAQFNQHVRDNLQETAPAKATTTGRLLVTSGLNAIAERIPTQAVIATSESTTSASFTDLTTVGPQVTVTTGDRAIVAFGAQISNSGTGASAWSMMDFAVSGASTRAASDDTSLVHEGASHANQFMRASTITMVTGLTAGSNTFTAKYRVGSGTGSYLRRSLLVIPL